MTLDLKAVLGLRLLFIATPYPLLADHLILVSCMVLSKVMTVMNRLPSKCP